MNLLVTLAQAAQQPAGKPNPLMQFIPFILIIGAMFFITIRSQKKQAAKRAEMMNTIIKGTEVILSNGFYGKIVEVLEKGYMVEIAPNVVVKIVEQGISSVVPKEEAK